MMKAFRSCVWLLALVMPFHALTSLHLDWRGPAHVHKTASVDSHAHHRAASHGHYAHVHEHTTPERHHHSANDESVVAAQDRDATEVVVWSRSATMVAVLVPAQSGFAVPGAASIRPLNPESHPATFAFARLERPPRTSQA